MFVGAYASIWYNVVIRGDINVVRVGAYSSVGEGTVIHTANSLPTGIPASVTIGMFVLIVLFVFVNILFINVKIMFVLFRKSCNNSK